MESSSKNCRGSGLLWLRFEAAVVAFGAAASFAVEIAGVVLVEKTVVGNWDLHLDDQKQSYLAD